MAKTKINRRKKEGISFKKSFILLFVLLLQLTTIVYLYVKLIEALSWLYFVSLFISILASLRVMIKTKNPDTKASWIFFILMFPTFGFLIYFLAGGSDIHPLHRKRLEKINSNIDNKLNFPSIENLSAPLKEKTIFLQKTTNSTAYQNTETKYFPEANLLFNDMKDELKKATKFIYLEFFIISNGLLFDEILNILIERANNGVEVKIIFDGFGSKDLMNRKLNKILKNNNIEALPFSPIKPIFSFYLNYRDHRKKVIIDNEISYQGGFNLADEYVNYIERFGYWKDNGLKLSGDAVNHITINFLKMWSYVSKKEIDYRPYINDNYKPLNNNLSIVLPYETGPFQMGSPARSIYFDTISKAIKSINIMTPYLIIDDSLLDLLINKAISGVEVNIIIPNIADKKSVYSLSKHLGRKLALAGCNIYAYEPGFIHSKTILIDDEHVIIGSINLDFRSFYQQYENAVFTNDINTVHDVRADFIDTIKKSIIIPKKVNRRFKNIHTLYLSILKWIAPLM